MGAQSREAITGSFQEEVALEMRSGTFQVVPGGRVGRAVQVEGAAGAKAGGRRAGRTEHSAFSRFPKASLCLETWVGHADWHLRPHAGRESVLDSSSLILRGPPRAWFAPKAPVGKGKESEVLVMNLHPVTY